MPEPPLPQRRRGAPPQPTPAPLLQALFESSMYIFVLVWGGAVASAVPTGASVPFGKIFSCLMAACAVGSALFSLLSSLRLRAEAFLPPVLLTAALALYAAAHPAAAGRAPAALSMPAVSPAWLHLVLCFIGFEVAVGVYFPAVGSMRAAHVPDAQRGAIMNITCAPHAPRLVFALGPGDPRNP